MAFLDRYFRGLWLQGGIRLLSRAAVPPAAVLTNGMAAAHLDSSLLYCDRSLTQARIS